MKASENKTEEFYKIKKSLLEENFKWTRDFNKLLENKTGAGYALSDETVRGQLPPRATKEMTCPWKYRGASRLRQQLSQTGEEDGAGGERGWRGDSKLPTPPPHPRTEPPGSTDKRKDRQASGGSSLKEQSQLWQQEMRDGLWKFLMWILLSRSKSSVSGHFWGEPKPHTHTHTLSSI